MQAAEMTAFLLCLKINMSVKRKIFIKKACFFLAGLQLAFLTLRTKQREKKIQKQQLEHLCKYRHISEFIGKEGNEKE